MKTLIIKPQLISNKKTGEKQKAWECPGCRKWFSSVNMLVAHLKTKHGTKEIQYIDYI